MVEWTINDADAMNDIISGEATAKETQIYGLLSPNSDLSDAITNQVKAWADATDNEGLEAYQPLTMTWTNAEQYSYRLCSYTAILFSDTV